eukprot:420993-Lingulodinium_polyedra.AAC.1
MLYGIVVMRIASYPLPCNRPSFSLFQKRCGGSISKSQWTAHPGCWRKEMPVGPVEHWSATTWQLLGGPKASAFKAACCSSGTISTLAPWDTNASHPLPVRAQTA